MPRPVLILLALNALLPLGILCACPDGWISGGGSCYRITDKPMNWHAAREVSTDNWSYAFAL